MGEIYGMGMSVGYHWLFWIVIVAVFAVVIFLVWGMAITR